MGLLNPVGDKVNCAIKDANNCVRKVRCRWGFIFCGEVGNIRNELLALAAK
jgi:hypothetical protein